MKTLALATAIALALVGSTVYAQDCGCGAPVPQVTTSACCNPCCDPCCHPLRNFISSIGSNLRNGACRIHNGVHSLFHPIRFCPTTCDPCNRGCGCVGGSSVRQSYGVVDEVWMDEPGMPGPPAPPVAPPTQTQPSGGQPTSIQQGREPAKFQPPGAWQPSPNSSRDARSAQRDAYFSRAGQPTKAPVQTARPATYFAR